MRQFLKFLPALLLGGWACLCGMPASAQPDAPPDKLSIILDWFPNPGHAALMAGLYDGFFARHQLEVKLITPADPGSPPRLVAAGQADMAISYQTQLSLFSERGINLARVGTLIDMPLDTLVTSDSIHTLADLKGKKLGVSLTGLYSAALRPLLKEAGLQLSDLKLVNVNFQLEQALMSGSVDAIIGAGRNYELVDLKQRGVKVHAYYPEEHGFPLSDELIFVARQDKAHDPRIRRFMQALREATIFLLNHPDEVWQQTIAHHPEMNTPLNKASWAATLPALCKNPPLLDKERYRALHLFLKEGGLVHKDMDLSRYAIDPTAP